LTDSPNEPFFSVAFAEHLKQSPPEFLYHYTSQDGLLGIIESRSLRATNISYMNDATEFDLSLGLLRDCLSDRQRMGGYFAKERARVLWQIVNKITGSSICITCFCEQGDLLSQWRGYSGGGSGYSLGFETSKLKELASQSGFLLGKCIYDPDLQTHIVKELVEYVLADAAPGKSPDVKDLVALLKYGAFFKNPSFAQEQEWRLVSALPTDIHFRKGKSMIIPYTVLDISAANNLCIQHAFVGPCPNMALATRSAGGMLMSNNVIVTVHPSSIPFRDW
jgi:hypothetical protein